MITSREMLAFWIGHYTRNGELTNRDVAIKISLLGELFKMKKEDIAILYGEIMKGCSNIEKTIAKMLDKPK